MQSSHSHAMSEPESPQPASEAGTPRVDIGPHRPSDRFWPYVQLPERPDAEELAALDPDLHDALYGPPDRPFSITLVFPKFDGPDYERAVALARDATEYREVGEGPAVRVRARFLPSEPLKLRTLFELVSSHDCEVLVDDRPVPYARELWLPLIWLLIPR